MEKYQTLGASASKAGLHNILKTTGLESTSGLFSAVYPDMAGDKNFSSFLHCDGAGTKCIVPYLLYKETGNLKYFAGLAQDALVMNLDDIYCIGNPQSLMLSNTIARSSKLIGDDIIEVLLKSYKELQEKLSDFGINIQLSGGETADCGDTVRNLVVDAVMAGRIENSKIINASNILPGNIIIGLSSTGKATYEDSINSGISSNGLTLARHALLSQYNSEKYPEILDPSIDKKNSYFGPYKVTDKISNYPLNVGEALCSPTRTFAPVLKKIYQELPSEISGVIHLTGGAQTKVLRFAKGNHYIKDNLFPLPTIFQEIQKHGEVSFQELYKVFNCGHRIEIYTDVKNLRTITDISKEFGIDAQQIGYVENNSNSEENQVTIKSSYGEFKYTL
ncbi:MAG: phosphoribosylformylglycinamidine cyclo-ligase [Proteobacteria bacterium]|nr:phosphoribosylformylglycinamidine cyclo-ligase [Pseudomonadota bacterium]